MRKMALATNVSRQLSNRLFKYKLCLSSAARSYAIDKSQTPWNHLWTPEEYKKKNHAKHAEKYHMHPDDYKPYDPYDRSMGDYPALPMTSPVLKDPYYPYDIPVYKKNYHEPIHDRFEMLSEDRYDFGRRWYVTPGRGALVYIAFMAILATITYVSHFYPISLQIAMEKQYPYKDKTYYTFEPVD